MFYLIVTVWEIYWASGLIIFFPSLSAGNMRHLIVEACIARNLLDTSAYFWPGYVNGRINQIPHSAPSLVPGWSSFLKGAALTPVMLNALVSTPASRYVLFPLYERKLIFGCCFTSCFAYCILYGYLNSNWMTNLREKNEILSFKIWFRSHWHHVISKNI